MRSGAGGMSARALNRGELPLHLLHFGIRQSLLLADKSHAGFSLKILQLSFGVPQPGLGFIYLPGQPLSRLLRIYRADLGTLRRVIGSQRIQKSSRNVRIC